MINRVAGKIKLQSVDELLGVPEISGTQEIEIARIHEFPNHPFKVLDDERMDLLVDSIRENGILNPVIVRPDQNGDYEMISGHRRLHAAGIAGLQKIRAIVKEMSDDEAIIKMVDANIQREEILPSERAFSLKMKMDAMRRQGSRSDLTSDNDCQKWSSDEIGETVGLKGRQVRNYIRLTYLIPEMYHEKEKAATGLEPVTAKLFLPNPYLDYFDKLEFGVCFINFFQSTQVRSWNPYFFQVHLWLLHNMIF